MVLYNLDSYQILTSTILLVPSLVAIWVLFLQKDLTEKSINFKTKLKKYEKEKAEKLLKEIQDATMDREGSEDSNKKSLEIIMKYAKEWELKSEAISRLLSKELDINKIGKGIIILLSIILFLSLYASAEPNRLFFGDVSRLSAAQLFFAIEIFLIIAWFYIIYDFGNILNKFQTGDISDIEDLIEEIAKKIEAETRKR